MRTTDRTKPWMLALLGSASAFALNGATLAQDDNETADDDALGIDTIVVTGIRRSLQASQDIKRDGQGVVEAITAEDMGKFPDTNLAESLQRVTGVSIDRRNGEGSQVTVRGFGPDYNLVLLNGRQMPTAFLSGGAPASRSFDFADLASEGIAGVRIYKTGRAALPTGGIGSTLNILTARPLDAPGLRYTVGAKAVIDNSNTTLGDDETTISPDISGLYSNTFMDNRLGISIAGAYQERSSGVSQFGTTSGWRGAYRGDENNWGTLPRDGSAENRPEGDQIYSVPQNANYSLTQIDRERINGQLALQFQPIDTLTTTLDYFYSQNRIATERSDLSVWFNHGDTDSAWGDGPIADILFYNEDFGGGTDLSMGAARLATKSEKNSIGFNADWAATNNLTVTLDVHSSSAESGADSPYGSAGVLSTADFALNFQGVDFRNELPVLSLGFFDPFTDISADRMRGTGSTFQDSFIRTEIDQAQLFAEYRFDDSIIESIDFGIAATRNDYRATFSNNQRDSWGGVGAPEDYPDDIWRRINLADNFDQFDGYQDTFQDFFAVDFGALLAVMDAPNAPGGPVCGGDGICTNDRPLAADRRTTEESLSGFFEVASSFDLGRVPASIVAGLRYEQTDVTSQALTQVPIGSQWVAENEFGLIFADSNDFTELTGEYDVWLPAVDFELIPDEDWVLRASYSHTMTRPSYADIQGGIVVEQLFRVDGGTASAGNPNLEPFLSKNFDLSAERYYDEGSYVSLGYFYKEVENFISIDTTFGNELFDSIVTPLGGARYDEAVAALGTTDASAVRQYIFQNADPSTVNITGVNPDTGLIEGQIFGVPGEDPTLGFRLTQPFNNNDTKTVRGWEAAWQHVLGDTGFGWILNYTVVDGDVEFNNLAVPSDGLAQTPLLGLSDSANVIGFYDKNGLQVRAAYNWRGQFLASAIGVSGTPDNPIYVEEYDQLDVNASYEVTDNFSVFLEGINITDETGRSIGRTPAYVNFATQTGSRYNVGVRYRF